MVSKRILRRWHPRLRDLISELRDEGYSLEQGGKHITVRTPSGRRVGTLSASPSDPRGQLNAVSDIRRAISES